MIHSTIITVQFGEGLSPGNNTSYSSPPRAVSERVQGIFLRASLPLCRYLIKERDILECCLASTQSLRDQDLAIPSRTTYNIGGLHRYPQLSCQHVVRHLTVPVSFFNGQSLTFLMQVTKSLRLSLHSPPLPPSLTRYPRRQLSEITFLAILTTNMPLSPPARFRRRPRKRGANPNPTHSDPRRLCIIAATVVWAL
jgi:hypothetical protein